MRHTLTTISLFLFVLLSVMLRLAPAPMVTTAAPIASIVVNTPLDVLAEDGVCSLREAITAANNDLPSGSTSGECRAGSGADTITLPEGTYTFALGGSEDDNLGGDLDITADLTIEGADRTTTIINAAHLDRVLHVITGTVLIQDVTITGGHAPNGKGSAKGANGGGGLNAGSLQFIRALILDNEAGSGGTNGTGGDGGAIYSTGQLSLIQTRIIGNRAGAGNGTGNGGNGGGLRTFAQATLIYSDLSNNLAGNGGMSSSCGAGGNGGGIYGSARVSIQTSTVSGNEAGAACNGSGGGGNGGGLFQESDLLLIVNGTVANNHVPANGTGGGIAGNSTHGNSIVADNTSGTSASDCAGVLAAPEGFVLLENPDGCTVIGEEKGMIVGQDPVLGLLADNGGFSYTHALLAGSPALDSGTCLFNTFDQRGLPRPVDLPNYPNVVFGCDFGAYEAQTEPPVATATPTITPTSTHTPIATPSATITATLSASATPPLTSSPVATGTPTATTTIVANTPTATTTATVTVSPLHLYLPLTLRMAPQR